MKKLVWMITFCVISTTAVFTVSINPDPVYAVTETQEQDPELPICIDDEEITEGLLPQLQEGRLFGPVRNISENLGAYVDYSQAEQEVSLIRDDINITMEIGSDTAQVYTLETGEEKHQLDEAMFVDEGRTFVPLRFLAESFGYYVDWDESSRTVTLKTPEDEEDKDKDEEDEEEEEEEKFEEKLKPEKIALDADTEEDDIKMTLDYPEGEFPEYELDFSDDDKEFSITVKSSRVDEYSWGFDDDLMDTITTETIEEEKEVDREELEDLKEDENKDDKDNENNDKDNKDNDNDEYDNDNDNGDDNEDEDDDENKEEEIKTITKYKSKIDVKLHYPVPELKENITDGTEADSKLEMVIPRLFEEEVHSEQLTDGLEYTEIRKGMERGPVNIYEMRLSPDAELKPDLIMANNEFSGFERLDDMAEENNGLAAINGGFFWQAGHPIGLYISEQRLIREPSDNRSALFYSTDHEATIKRSYFHGGEAKIQELDLEIDVDGVNRNRTRGDAIIYTPEHGESTDTTTSTARNHQELTIENGKIHELNPGDSDIPSEGMVLSIHETYTRDIDNLDQIEEDMEIEIDWDLGHDKELEEIAFGLGGGPRIMEDGDVDIRSKEEDISENITTGRSPRTTAGVTSEGELILTVVDGRQSNVSIGMTLEELGDLMAARGADDALNLDGGGSSMMWLDGEYQNNPNGNNSYHGIRELANAIILTEE